MAQAIITKYAGATNSNGARIIVKTADGQRLVVSWNYEMDAYRNHLAAAYALCEKLGWDGVLFGGDLKDGYAWVRVS